MQIRPVERFDDKDDLKHSLNEGSISQERNDITVYDIGVAPYATHNGINDTYGSVCQTIESVVKGFPKDTNLSAYCSSVENRNTFIKRTYFYNGYFNSIYKDRCKMFAKGILKPAYMMVTGFTDAKPISDNDFNPDRDLYRRTMCEFYSITVYGSATKVLSTYSVIDPITGIPFGRLDVCSPNDIINREIEDDQYGSTMGFGGSICSEIPTSYYGNDLLAIAQPKLSFVDQHTCINDMDIENQKLHEALSKGLSTEIMQSTADSIEARMIMRNFMVDSILKSVHSMLESYTYLFETGKKDGFVSAVTPFKVIVNGYTLPILDELKSALRKLCLNIQDRYLPNGIRITFHYTTYEQKMQITFLENKEKVTMRMTVLEAISELVSETLYRENGGAEGFRRDMDLDIMSSYSMRDKNGNSVTHQGNLK